MKKLNSSNLIPPANSKLSKRQLNMISISGVIGAGLFIGSAKAINIAGPSILFSYTIAGILVLLIMRMLGEMIIMQPDYGSFSTYATISIGHWAGFTIGWLYWWFWILVISVEAIAGADIICIWFPSILTCIYPVFIVLIMSLINLCNIKYFGEIEFWFSLIKVVSIITYIIICILAVIGLWPLSDIHGITRLFNHGGLMPKGFGAVFEGILITIFSFFGAEILIVASIDSEEPIKQIKKSTSLIIYRIILFYLISIFLSLCIINWDDPHLIRQGTFQYVLLVLNIPKAKFIVDFVVLIAIISCINSAIYTSSRMFYSLSCRNDGPVIGKLIFKNGIPYIGVIFSTLSGLIGCLANYLFPHKVLNYLLSSTGAIALLVYLVITISQLKMRNIFKKQGLNLKYKMWLFPWFNFLCILIILSVLIYMIYIPIYRYETILTVSISIIILLFSLVVTRNRSVSRVDKITSRRKVNIEINRF